MKRVFTIKGQDNGVELEVRASVKTKNFTRDESENIAESLANRLFENIKVPYASFGVHNTTVSL